MLSIPTPPLTETVLMHLSGSEVRRSAVEIANAIGRSHGEVWHALRSLRASGKVEASRGPHGRLYYGIVSDPPEPQSVPPNCERCGAPATNVNSHGEYTGTHLDVDECLRSLRFRLVDLEKKLRELAAVQINAARQR